VTFDALRADHLGSIGSSRPTSPELDAFAQDALVFRRALSQSGSTVTSLPSLFTSKFTFVDGIHDELGLAPGQRTRVHDLRDAGYDTAAVIGWRYAGSPAGVQEGFDVFDEDMEQDENAARTVARAEALLPQLEEPFFLWVHLRPPHRPYDVREETFSEFYALGEGEPALRDASLDALRAYYRDRERLRPYHYFGRRRKEGLTPSMLRQLRASYAASVREADAAFGTLVAAIRARASRPVVLAADHGESLGEHAFLGHNQLYYEILHTPILVRVPGVPGGVVERPVMNVDLMPTLLETVGVAVSEPVRGHNLFAEPEEEPIQFAGYEDRRTLIRGDDQVIVSTSRTDHFDRGSGRRTTGPLPPSALALAERARSMRPLGSKRSLPLRGRSETFEALRALGYIE
jgi:arylsulfatase